MRERALRGAGGLGLDDLRRAVADRDLARLLGLGDFPLEVDVQQAMIQAGALHYDIVGELEATLERARRDALIEHLAGGLTLLGLLVAADGQGVLLDLQ